MFACLCFACCFACLFRLFCFRLLFVSSVFVACCDSSDFVSPGFLFACFDSPVFVSRVVPPVLFSLVFRRLSVSFVFSHTLCLMGSLFHPGEHNMFPVGKIARGPEKGTNQLTLTSANMWQKQFSAILL